MWSLVEKTLNDNQFNMDNKYLFVEYDERESLLSAEWIPAVVGIEDMKAEMMRMLDMIKEKHPKNVLVDSRHFKLRASDDVQYWINFKFMPLLVDEDIDKYAIVVNEPTYKELMVEEEEEEVVDLSEFMTVKYFTEGKAAEAWMKG
jgi:predicted sugar kinase